MKKQVIGIRGGDAFDTQEDYLKFLNNFKITSLDFLRNKKWRENLQEDLGEDFEFLSPEMPNTFNCKYSEWKVWFEKFIPLFNEEIILIGNSQGGIFLIKYLAENNFPKQIKSLHIIAAPFDNIGAEDWSLADFILPVSLDNVSAQVKNIFLYQSKDDPIVPFHNIGKYKKALPEAHEIIFENRGHFRQPHFPELVENIKKS